MVYHLRAAPRVPSCCRRLSTGAGTHWQPRPSLRQHHFCAVLGGVADIAMLSHQNRRNIGVRDQNKSINKTHKDKIKLYIIYDIHDIISGGTYSGPDLDARTLGNGRTSMFGSHREPTWLTHQE